jgi:hypothetical protein
MTVNTHIFFFGLIAFPKTKLIISLLVTGFKCQRISVENVTVYAVGFFLEIMSSSALSL